MSEATFRQRQYMRKLFTQFGSDQKKVCAAYAKAERGGLVTRSRDEHDTSPEAYAAVLWRDALRYGWLTA